MTYKASAVIDRLGRLVFWLSVLLLLGRLLGFLRELVLARLLGVSTLSDQAVILLSLPDMFVNLLLAGGLGSALIPALAKTDSNGQIALIKQFTCLGCMVFLPIAFFIAAFPEAVLAMLAPGATFPDSFPPLIRWLGCAVFLSALTGIFAALLNARNRFFIAGCGGLIFNSIVLCALALSFLFEQHAALLWLTGGVVMACLIRFLVTIIPLLPDMVRYRAATALFPQGLLLKQFFFALGAVGFVQLMPVLVRAFSTHVGDGALAAFNYAHKLIELPVSVALTSIGLVILPTLADLHHKSEFVAFNQIVVRAIVKSLCLAVVILCGALVATEWVVSILFGGGAMSELGLSHVKMLVLLLAWTLPLVGVSNIASTALSAMSRQGLLLISALISLTITCAYLMIGSGPGAYNVLGVSMVIFYASHTFCTGFTLFWLRRGL